MDDLTNPRTEQSPLGMKCLEEIIRECASRLGYRELKDEQITAISSFVQGNDIFVALPTGYGKSLIYAVLPYVFDVKRGRYLCCFHL